MPAHRKPAVSAFIAALLSAIYTAWAAELGFHTSNIGVLFGAAVAATATAWGMILAARGLQQLRDRRVRPVARP